jgi:hypothetical protein
MSTSVQEGVVSAEASAVSARSLLDHDQSDLAELFADLAPVTGEEMTGEWAGDMAGVIGLGRLPRPVRRLVHAGVSSPLGPWQGKRFEGSGGANIWGGPTRRTDWLRFRSEPVEHSPVDGEPALWLDYDIAANPKTLRPVRGELRRLAPAVVLGRMTWKTASGLHCLLYFPLRRAD